MTRGTASQETRPGGGYKTGDFVKEKLRGATVELIYHVSLHQSYDGVLARGKLTQGNAW